jgi:hypothetical protein
LPVQFKSLLHGQESCIFFCGHLNLRTCQYVWIRLARQATFKSSTFWYVRAGKGLKLVHYWFVNTCMWGSGYIWSPLQNLKWVWNQCHTTDTNHIIITITILILYCWPWVLFFHGSLYIWRLIYVMREFHIHIKRSLKCII